MPSGPELVLYSDGGANPNPGPGGWGVVLTDGEAVLGELSGSAPDTTNNRMELSAAIAALESQDPGSVFTLVTDSQYVRQGITTWIRSWLRNDWMRGRPGAREPVKNADLWKRLHELDEQREVHWRWTKGHAGNRFNERADELASREIEKISGGSGPTREAESSRGGTADLGDFAWHIVLRVRCVGRRGGWAAEVRDPSGEVSVRNASDPGPVSANRLELLGGLSLLEEVPLGESVLIECGDYLRRGATEWLSSWRSRGWKTAGGEPVKNADLWRSLASRLDSSVGFARADSTSDTMKRLRTVLRSS